MENNNKENIAMIFIFHKHTLEHFKVCTLFQLRTKNTINKVYLFQSKKLQIFNILKYFTFFLFDRLRC